jgi:hypothetical protein
MATLRKAIMNEQFKEDIIFDLEDIEEDLGEEEMQGRSQSANGDSIDHRTGTLNPSFQYG